MPPKREQGTGADDALAALRRAVARAGKPLRSPLYVWMRARRTAFAAYLDEERPTWQALAQGFAAQGFTGPDGGPMNPNTLRQIWWRVRRDAARRQAGQSAMTSGPGPLVASVPAPAAARPFDRLAPGPEQPVEPEPEFKPATLKGRARRPPADGDPG